MKKPMQSDREGKSGWKRLKSWTPGLVFFSPFYMSVFVSTATLLAVVEKTVRS